ncbi:MAG TPA: OmpA family protein [Azospirillum sp.]|nr:OmpA family protein [Azospirillum sp.]
MAPRDHGVPELPADLATPPWAAGGGRVRMPAAGGAEEDQEIWLLSYSDLVTLLFAVFVMLLAITTLKDQLPTTPLPTDSPAVTVPAAAHAAVPERPPPAEPPKPDHRPRLNAGEVAVEAPEPLLERWRERLAALGIPTGVAVNVRQNRVGIVLGDAILFAAGQAELSPDGRAVLAHLVPVLAAAPGDIVVEGHTDSTPIASGRFPSNWELSAARAAAVVRALSELGLPPARLSAAGYADTRPLTPERDAASRARNRRVAITIQAEE